MKKISLIALALGLAFGASAQVNVLKEAERAMKSGEDYSKVLEIVKPAFTDPTTAQNAQTYFIPGEAAFKQYDKMLGVKQFGQLKTKADSLKMDMLLIPAYEYMVKALPLDTVVNEKGKVKTKYSKDIIGQLQGHYNDYYVAGVELWNLREYKASYDVWGIFLDLNEIPAVAERLSKAGLLQPDSIRAEIAYNQALAAWQIDNLDGALKAFMRARDMGYSKKPLYDYAISVALGAGNNEAVLELAKEALPLYGSEDPQYIGQIVNYYLQKESYDEAFNYINEAIMLDGSNAQYYVIQGVLFDNTNKKAEAKAAFKTAMDLDAQNAQAFYNYGRALCEEAYALNDAAPTTQVEYDNYYNEKIKPLFLEAVEVLENAYSINPDNRDVLLYLENAYYNLKDEKMYNDVQNRKNY